MVKCRYPININIVDMSKKRLSKPNLKTFAVLIVAAVVLAGIITIVVRRNNQRSNGSNNPPVTTVPSTNTYGRTLQSKGSSSNPAGTKPISNQTIPTSELIAPYGTFVSNHYPSLSGSGAPSQEESTCTTSPGANCYIQFTKAGVTKRLATQVTDESGSASWVWDVKKSNLTVGDWVITAVATSGNNSKSRQDSILLTVSK